MRAAGHTTFVKRNFSLTVGGEDVNHCREDMAEFMVAGD